LSQYGKELKNNGHSNGKAFFLIRFDKMSISSQKEEREKEREREREERGTSLFIIYITHNYIK